LITYLWIAIGGALGSMARYACANLVAGWIPGAFPWGTIGINILGSFVIGAFFTLTGPDGRVVVTPDVRQFVIVGICGGYTTFSSFSLQTLNLMRAGDMAGASLNVAGSVALCLLAVWLGYFAATHFNQLRGG
jgi:CrcB protein